MDKTKREKRLKVMQVLFKILMITIATFLILLGIYGLIFNFGNNAKGILPDYKVGGILMPYDEYILEPVNEIHQRDAYVDKEGKIIRPVPDKLEIGNIQLPNKDQVDKFGNPKDQYVKDKIDKSVENYEIKKVSIPVNEKDKLTPENFEKSKELIERQLHLAGINNARIAFEKQEGKIVLRVPNEKYMGSIVAPAASETEESLMYGYAIRDIVSRDGTFKVSDSETGLEYLTEKEVEKINIFNGGNGQIGLEIKLNKKGREILSDISRKYVERLVEENGKKITHKAEIDVYIGDEKITSTTFEEPIDNGYIHLNMLNTQKQRFNEDAIGTLQRAKTSVELGKIPVKYSLVRSEKGIKTDLNTKVFIGVLITAGIIIVISLLVYVLRYGLRGVGAVLVMLSYIAAVVTFLRFTNLVITIPSIMALGICYIFEYIILAKCLEEYKRENKTDYIYNTLETIIPALVFVIASILFSYSLDSRYSSFAMTGIVGIIMLFVHNFVFVKRILGNLRK